MSKPILTLIQGGRGNKQCVKAEKKSLHERMTATDRVKEAVYRSLSLSFYGWISYRVQLWASGKLGALHGKYNYPGEDDYIEIANHG